MIALVAASVASFAWWLVLGEQRWLRRSRDWLLLRFPSQGDVWQAFEVIDATPKTRRRLRINADQSGTVVKGHPFGKLLTCSICAAFWLGVAVMPLGLAHYGRSWVLFPWLAAFAALMIARSK